MRLTGFESPHSLDFHRRVCEDERGRYRLKERKDMGGGVGVKVGVGVCVGEGVVRIGFETD